MSYLIARQFVSGVVVQRKSTVSNGKGGYKETWADHLNINGRLRPLTAHEVLAADKVTPKVTDRLYCLPCDIAESDRVYFGGKTYEVKAVRDPSHMGRHYEVDLELIPDA